MGLCSAIPGVREELMQADLVLPSLDAATDQAFRKINRPAGSFTIDANTFRA